MKVLKYDSNNASFLLKEQSWNLFPNFLLFDTETVSKQTYMYFLMNKLFLFSITKEFLMQDIAHLYKTYTFL